MKQRIIGLDLLRIALAFLVFMFHSQMHFGCDYSFLNGFVEVGAIAMTGFFMLSGYVLYYTYSGQELMSKSSLKTFYVKRAITIIPLYLFIAVAFTACDFFFGHAKWDEYIILFPVEALCLQSTFSSLFGYIHNDGTWFISCLVICYVIYPFIQTVTLQMTKKSRLILWFLLVFIILYAPLVQIFFKLQTIYSNPFYRLIEFTIGVLLAPISEISDSGCLKILRTKCSSLIITVTFVILILLARHIGVPAHYMLFNWIAVPCFCALILSIAKIPFSRIANNKTILYLSSISFTFFLCQVLPLWAISHSVCEMMGTNSNLVKIVVSLSICMIGAIFIHECVERPLSKLLKRKLLLSSYEEI